MRPVAALVAITLLVLTGPLVGAAPAAGAAVPGPVPEPAGAPLRLTLTDMSPRVVTAGGPEALTVTGVLANTGDLPVAELEIRVQRGDPLTTEGELRDALDGTAGTDAVTPDFTPLPGELAPGGQVPVRLTVPLRGAPETSLALGDTGVHELLVNVNGVPRDGDRARLAAVRMLLPVLSLPGEDGGADGADGADGRSGEPAVPFSLLYPITDTPRRLSTVPGQTTLLTDDDLAASLAPGGRLGGLVSALAEEAPAGSRVREGTCLAVDPDLVETAAAMRAPAGYSYLGADGVPVPGTGAEAAGRWLDGLAEVAAGACVIALPYADADLVALTRGGLGELASGAVGDGRQILADLLGTPVVAGATWPEAGVLDEPTLERTAAAGGRALLLSAEGVQQGRTPRTRGVVPVEGGQQQFAVLTDPLLTTAAVGPPPASATGLGRGSAVPPSSPAGAGGALSTQDAIGALTFRAGEAPGPATAGAGPVVLAPPHQWDAGGGTGARALLDSVEELLDAGMLLPAPLGPVLRDGPADGAGALPVAYPLDAGGREVPTAVVDAVGVTAAGVTDLRSAAVSGSPVGITPEQVFTPLQRGLVRPASVAWRLRPEAATRAADAGRARVDALRASVRVLEPPSPYSLGTSDAPILITVANELPVTVEVRVEIAPSPGLRVAPIEMQQVPPQGRRQVRVNAEVTRSGQFTVQASVRSPGGELLGPPSRLRVRSTAYGTITVWLTGSAGVLLVVLAVRRVLRRVRGEPDPAVPVRPEPDRPEPDPDPRTAPLPEPHRPPHPRPPPPGGEGPDPDRGADRPGGLTGDPFPDAVAVTERLPTTRPQPRPRPRPEGPPRPPAPRVPSP